MERNADVGRLNRELRMRDNDIEQLNVKLRALETRRRHENIAYRRRARTGNSINWSELSEQYCKEFGVNSVSMETLRAYASAARSAT